MKLQPIAHVKQDELGNWTAHALSDHLRKVGNLSSVFAEKFKSEEWLRITGNWHDIGKYRPRFQAYIRDRSGFERENAHIEMHDRPRHSTAGALHATKEFGPFYGHIIAYLIAGHHAGLADWVGGLGSLSHRLNDPASQDEYSESLESSGERELFSAKCPPLPEYIDSPDKFSLWMRMLFSSLVDADFLDTESFMAPDKSNNRGQWASLSELSARFNSKIKEVASEFESSPLSAIRNEIREQCLNAAVQTPGIFSLTVPTGGGKTLSSLAFALKHALVKNKQRIIYAIPFTSIIEQNASVFRTFLGEEDAILEHHSNLDTSDQQETNYSRLACENWDAPIIVTTNVQLFESLHAARTSRCRKLHNLINSVIILDEAQQLPRDFHAPITQVMQQLSDHYGVTWVLCTATQPVLGEYKNPFGNVLMQGLRNVREIIKKPHELASKLNARVQVHMPSPAQAATSWTELAAKLTLEESVLCIVNTRQQARELFQLLPDPQNCIHLSAQMCAEHRSELIKEIKNRLSKRQNRNTRPIRVISTQLIEAGVDVDFPVVFRAMTGLDSIAQSAGRCNRENKLNSPGNVFVFKPEQSSLGYLRQASDVTSELLSIGALEEPLSPDSFQRFFELLNSKGERDKHDIMTLLSAKSSKGAPLEIYFREASKRFRLIDDNGESIIVPFKPAKHDHSPIHAWLSMLEKNPSLKWIYRKLQRYTVTVPERIAIQLRELGCIDIIAGLQVLHDGFYHQNLGIYTPDLKLSGQESVI